VFADPKSRRNEFAQILQAAGHVEDPIAVFAPKMVMVPLTGALVAGRLTRNFNRGDRALVEQRADRAIDGRNAEPVDPLRGGFTQLADAQRAIGTREYVSYDLSRVLKYYAITLQPNNFLSPMETPNTPNAPYTAIDDSPNLGNTYQSYIQDSWRMGRLWEADYGLRYDFFTIKSAAFDQGFGAFSPRLKLTRFFGTRASVYGYIGRFFEPFSFENVSPEAAYLLNLPLSRTEAQFDLKPERDTQLELGGHIPVGPGDLGFRVWQKNANDLIDDTEVGVTLLHQDINYVLGRLSQEALNYTQPLAFNSRAYFAIAHVVSLNSGCETQLLAPCFGQPTGFTPADHEQRYTINSGILLNNRRGGWFSEGIPMSPKTALTLDIQNILNDRYYVTLLNAQGNHFGPGREFNLGVRFKP
jgi:TonB dependent receptor